jgi:uncharacterized HAD superfamily protein
MKIGIDIDGVIAELIDALHLWHDKEYNFSRLVHERTDFSLAYQLNCSQEESLKRLFEFFKTEDFKKVLPVKDSIEAINNLAKNHELHVITARSKRVEEETLRWLNEHFSLDNFEKIHISGHDDGHNLKKSKGENCLELGIELMIEDCLAYAKEIASKGVKVLLFDRPWNPTETLPDNIIRVKSWEEIVEYINSTKSL